MGIRHFIVPGNKVQFVQEYNQFLQTKLHLTKKRFSAPGFVTQNGVISETGKVAGEYWDAIVGRDITKHNTIETMINAINNLVSQITVPVV